MNDAEKIEGVRRIVAAIAFNVGQLAAENEIDDFPDVEGFVEKTMGLIEEVNELIGGD